jgi:hypothetical protein
MPETLARDEHRAPWPTTRCGPYVFPHGLAALTIDREADIGTYWEPNVYG